MRNFKKSVIDLLSSKNSLSVAVHDGLFHSDDVFCVALLRRLAKECGFELKLYRTRDPKILSAIDMRVDVGGRYSEETWDFDHHQKDEALMQPEGVKHAAIGLLCKWCMTPEFYQIFKAQYLLGLEYQDNNGKSHPMYSSIGFWVQPMLPAFGEECDVNEAFENAVKIAEVILERALKTVEGLLKAEEELPNLINESIAGGKILVLKKRVPILQQLHPELAFTILQVDAGYSFLGVNGHLLPPHLRGLRGEQIGRKCGYEGVFTHPGGFTGTMCSLEGAKEICVRSL